MDFASTVTDSEKRSIMAQAISDVESQIRRVAWTVGIDPAALSASYTAPAAIPSDDYVLENKLEDLCARHTDLKAKRDAVPS
jgi:hypothetical protein|tara:strand:+ start:220 stop:465 length:246 start_codon:yes stop_codon:yes gene_type:complete